jgi:predicted Fe-Mo cluster-binding NifX family protein
MRIAIPCQGEELTDPVDSRLGRARSFLVYETDTSAVEVLNNHRQVEEAHGAGTQAAQLVLRERVDVVLTPRCGPKALDLFRASGVRLFKAPEGTVAEAIAAWERGELSPLENAHARAGA